MTLTIQDRLPEAARRSLSLGLRQFGRATAELRVLPLFLVVGGQRCGTTSLHRAIRQHPAVVDASMRKGVHFFDLHYERGIRWYRGHFPTRAAVALRERRLGESVIAGESSPYYMFHPYAADRIAADLPGVRLVAMLRDPIERAYSAWAHEKARGFESLPFADALAAEPERLAGELERMEREPHHVSPAHQHNAYISRGRYVEQLRHLERAIGRDRLHVIDSHDFFAEPAPVLDRLQEFLGLSRSAHVTATRQNDRPRSPMDSTLRARLTQQMADSDAELSQWWGQVPSWRRGGP